MLSSVQVAAVHPQQAITATRYLNSRAKNENRTNYREKYRRRTLPLFSLVSLRLVVAVTVVGAGVGRVVLGPISVDYK